MKKAELIKVLVFLSNAYPRKFKFPLKTKRDNKEFIETWYDFLGDYDYLTVKNTAKKIRSQAKLNEKVLNIIKTNKQFCTDCVFDPATCGRDVKECRKEADLYFEFYPDMKIN